MLLGLAGSAMDTLHAYSYLDCPMAAKGGLWGEDRNPDCVQALHSFTTSQLSW